MEDHTAVLHVSYLSHYFVALLIGWSSGKAAVSKNGDTIVTSNLYDGFDCYSTSNRSYFHTFRTRITTNIPLPIEFIHDGAALLFGSSCGDVTIWELVSHNWEDSLRHDGMYSNGNRMLRINLTPFRYGHDTGIGELQAP